MLGDDLNGKEIQKSGDVCVCIADTLRYTLETNTTVYPITTLEKQIFINKRKNNNFKKKTEIQKEVQPPIPLNLSPLPQTWVISYLFIINSFLLGSFSLYYKHDQGSHVL